MNPIMKAFVAIHIALYRLTGGKLGGRMAGQIIVLLTTTGNKSGKSRTVPIMCFVDGGEKYVIGSAGGSPRHPAWFNNLQARPEATIELDGKKIEVRASVVTGDERAALWKKIVAAAPGFGEYEKKAQGREIPVVHLKPVS